MSAELEFPLDLDEILNGIGPGRKPGAPVHFAVKRELTPLDLAQAATQGTGVGAVAIKELRNSHHGLARLLAQGIAEVEISSITGYTASRISVLKADPTFQELLAYYEEREKTGYDSARADMHERLAAVGFDSLEELHARVLDSPEKFTHKELLAIVELSADRTGYGKTATIKHEQSVSDETLARIRNAVSEGKAVSETDRGALLCLASAATELHSESESEEGEQGGGAALREEGDC